MAKQIKYADGTFGQGVEWLHDVLYDRLILASAGPLQTSLFRNKAGDTRNAVLLTLADTNNVAQQVPVKQKWYFWKMTVRYNAIAVRADASIQLILDFYRNTIIQFNIQNLDKMFTVPLSYFMPGDQWVSVPAATVNSRYPKGSSSEDWELKVPLVLEENAVWSLDVVQLAANGAALNGDYIQFIFDREMYRQGG